MNESSPQTRSGSGRRRPNRHAGKASTNKAYVSESDTPGRTNLQYVQEYGPQTPQKPASNSPLPGHHISSGQRTGNKSRQRNAAASPDNTQNSRQTPDSSTPAVKPSSAMAYAGATFHASPAPSALPMPSFMAKVKADSVQPVGTSRPIIDPYTSADELEQSTPQKANTFGVEESPLDAIFRADRAEKERARRTSSAHSASAIFGPHSPPSQPSPNVSRLFGSNPSRISTGTSPRTQGISVAELNGTPGQPFGPAFSTPYSDRIRSSRANPPASATNRAPPQSGNTEDRSEALKRFLWGNRESGPGSQAAQQPATASSVTVAPKDASARQIADSSRPADIAAMEDDLRRILKIRS